MTTPRLESIYVPAADPRLPGRIHLVVSADPSVLTPESTLGLTCVLPLSAGDTARARVVERTGSHVRLAPLEGAVTDGIWDLGTIDCGVPARHANDGPASAWIVTGDGDAVDVGVVPMICQGDSSRPAAPAPRPAVPSGPDALTPPPRTLDSAGPIRRGLHVRFEGAHAGMWSEVAALADRLCGVPRSGGDEVVMTAALDPALGRADHRLVVAGPTGQLAAGSADALRHGMITLAQLVRHGMPETLRLTDGPRHEMRVVMLDLARRWQEPGIVERLIDLAAWRKLSHVHLHLTDDEGWRLPSRTYPALGEVGGARGHGLPLPPLLGSGPAPTGRAYTTAEIARWVARADALGVVLIPEIDIPAHCHAALTARPELRDPDDISRARSVQSFPDNALVPGHPETARFLHDVFGELADLFPHSPTLHLGGDEVPPEAWTGSPIAARAAAAHGLEPGPALAALVVADAVAAITAAGRRWAGWEEVAAMDLPPAANHVVAWTSADAVARVAAGGHRVVAAPGDAYYLDMAASDAWEAPGISWAGTVPLERTCAFVPPDGVAGVQACLWAEHLVDVARIDAMMFPRLDAVAERGWTGAIHGGADGVRARSAAQPRFTSENG